MINPWDIDSELNPTGIEQANTIGKKLQSEGYIFDIIISSPLKRARVTADIIAEKIWYWGEIVEIADLKEKYAWVFKDYYKKQLSEEFWVSIVEEVLQKYPNKTFEWTEWLADFEKRVKKAFSEIRAQQEYQNKNILIVSHGWVIEAITWISKIGNCELIEMAV